MKTVAFAFSALRVTFLQVSVSPTHVYYILLPFPTMSALKDQDFTKLKLNGSVVSFKKSMD